MSTFENEYFDDKDYNKEREGKKPQTHPQQIFTFIVLEPLVISKEIS